MSEPADPAPTPWQINSTSILDANGRLVCVLAGRLMQQNELIAQLALAPELYRLLLAVESNFAGLPLKNLLLDDIRAMIDRVAND